MVAPIFNLRDVLERNRQLYGNSLAFMDERAAYTHSEYYSLVSAIGRRLVERGITPGSRICVLGLNSIVYVAVIQAAACIGAVAVPLNWRLSDSELRIIALDASPAVIYLDAEFENRATAFGDIPVTNLLYERELASLLDEKFVGVTRQEFASLPSTTELNASLIIYTAATDGKPKGAVLPYERLLAGTYGPIISWRLTSTDVNIGALPLFHVAGQMIVLATQRVGGATILFRRFRPEKIVPCAARHSATLLFEFSPMLAQLLDQLDVSQHRWDSLRIAAGIDTSDTVQRMKTRFPESEFWSGYGKTETGGLVAIGPFSGNIGVVGRAVSNARIAILELGTNNLCPTGKVGEIIVRADSVCTGYWNGSSGIVDPTTNSEGWYHTDDLGSLDEHGNLSFRGPAAKVGLIKTKGENVYSAEVEGILMTHQAVNEACVFGVSDATNGALIKAACVLKPGYDVNAETLSKYVGSKIAKYKRPNIIVFVDSLPTTPDGKTDRELVRRLYG